MIMKKRKIWIFIMVMLLSFIAVGCGKKADDGFDPNAIAYLAEYHDTDFGDGYIQSMVVKGDFIYLYTSEWIEAESRSVSKLLEVSIADGSTAELALFELGENEWISSQGMALNSSGNLILLASRWTEEDGNTYSLYEASFSGEKLSTKDIGDMLKLGQDTYLQGMYTDKQDNLYFVVSSYGMSSSYELFKFDKDLNPIARLESPSYIENLFITDNGKVYIAGWFESGMAVKEADFSAGSFGPDITFTGLGRYGSMRFAVGGPSGLLCSDGSKLMACDIESETATMILDWLEADVNANDIRYFGQLENGNYWLMNQVYRNTNTKTELIALTETTYGRLPKRENLVYASLYMDYNLKSAIVDFNKSSQKYRIRIKEYYDFSRDDESWEAAITQFNTDLASGNAPDIINLTSINFHQLASKGIFQDLHSYFDKNGIDRTDYLENVLNAYDVDGKLFGVMINFSVNTLVGHSSKLAGIDKWNVDQMMDWAGKYPDAMLMNTTGTGIMTMFAYSILDRFIDWQTGKCSFDGDEFIRIMEFAATFSNDWEAVNDWNNPDRIGTYTGLSEGHYLLSDQYINELNSMQIIDHLFDGEPQFIGYPTEKGSGIMLNPQTALAVSSKSKHKDGAFELINYLLSDQYQMPEEGSYYYSIPIKKNAFDVMLEMATTPPEDSYWEGEEQSRMSYGFDDFNVSIYISRNKEYVDVYKDLIMRADGIRVYDENIKSIIEEEAASFFAGQKSAREVAEIIQNRVQVYVNENR